MFLDALMALRLLFFVDLSISVLLIPIERSGKFFNIRNPIEARVMAWLVLFLSRHVGKSDRRIIDSRFIVNEDVEGG